MKIRVISKLAQNEPAYQELTSSRNTQRNLNALIHSRPMQQLQSEYFPIAEKIIPKNRLHGCGGNKINEFFSNFDGNCSVYYQRVEKQPQQVCRRLTPLLQAIEASAATTPFKDDYQFSFQKQNIRITPRNQCPMPFPQQHQVSSYYLQNSNRPKIKLRKFHSLIAIKNDTTAVAEPIPIRRNHSMLKKEGIIRLFQVKGKMRNNTENEQQRISIKGRESVRTQAFEEEKQRLGRIRKELNEIYNAKRDSQLRLKLY